MKADKVLEQNQRTRLANLRILARRYRFQSELSRDLGYAGRASVALLLSGARPITERTARRVEEMLKLPAGWMDQKRKGDDK